MIVAQIHFQRNERMVPMSDYNFGKTSGLSGMLGDYNSIRNGSYGKLLRKYYGESTATEAAKSSVKSQSKSNVLDRILQERRNPSVSKEVSSANSKLSSSVSGMKSSLSTLQNAASYKDTEGGVTARDKVKEALKDYVSSYNDAVDSSKKSSMSSVSSNVAGAVKATTADRDALKEIGITVDNKGKLSFDEKKFQNADLDKVKDVFDGNKALSYGSEIASRLNRVSSTSDNATVDTATAKASTEDGSVTKKTTADTTNTDASNEAAATAVAVDNTKNAYTPQGTYTSTEDVVNSMFNSTI